MAAKQGSSEHAYKQIQQALKADALPSLLYFHGREQYLLRFALQCIEKAYIAPGCDAMDLSRPDPLTLTPASLQEQCETLPLLSRKRLVIVQDFPPLLGRPLKNYDESAFCAYLKDLPDSVCLIFTRGPEEKEQNEKKKEDGGGRKSSALLKTIKSCGAVYEFGAMSAPELRDAVRARARRLGKGIRSSALEALIARSGYLDRESTLDFFSIAGELEKAAAHAAGDEILQEDVDATVSDSLESNVFRLTDALGAGRRESALRLLHELLRGSENFYKLLAIICGQYEDMLRIREMQEEDLSAQEIRSRLNNMHEYRYRRLSESAAAYTPQQLRAALLRCCRIDRSIKSGLLPQELAMELFIASV